jgi:Flp pilus assembly protein TadD
VKPKRTAADLAGFARKFMDARQYERCLYLCDLAEAEDPKEPSAHFVRGLCLDAMERFEEALAPLAKAAALRPRDAEIQAGYGEALDHAGRLEAALERYGAALSLDAELLEPLLARASVSGRLGDFKSALSDLEAYLKRRPDSARALILRACALVTFDRKDAAREDFARAVRVDPSERERVERLSAELL